MRTLLLTVLLTILTLTTSAEEITTGNLLPMQEMEQIGTPAPQIKLILVVLDMYLTTLQ